MTPSKVLRKLRGGEIVRMINLSRVTGPWLCEAAGKLGVDAVWLDLEHREFGYDAVSPMALACRATGADLVVRILKTGYTSTMRVLESGANGVMVPHCLSAEEARQWVEWSKFPPLGRRGFDGAGADADYALANALEHLRHANAETFLMMQIEDREAVDCVDEIAAVEGIDLLFVGPADLSISLGIPMQFDDPLFTGALERVAAAAARRGKWWGIASPGAKTAQRAIDLGARLVNFGSDHGWLLEGLKRTVRDFAVYEGAAGRARSATPGDGPQ